MRWSAVSRRRWWAVWSAVVFVVLFVVPIAVGAVATAQTGSGTGAATDTTAGGNAGLSWMNVRDSSGVQVSNYFLVLDYGSLFRPGTTAISLVLNLEFAGWTVIVTTAIWLIGWALSFKWLNVVAAPLRGTAEALTGQIATPLMLVAAATIGAFFVAYFVVRGFYTRATMQVVTMLLVAIIGTLFLAEPLGEVLGPEGWLAQGRNVGLSVAAGLNGKSDTDPTMLVETMQTGLADNYARKPLQIWNFGHAVDGNPTCRSMWSAGINSGNEDRLRNGMKACGDGAAYEAAGHATAGQIGAGLMLLISGVVVLIFALYMGLRIITAGFQAVYHGFMAIFGFAAGGFIYGPTQTFLIRNVVDAFIAAGRMTIFTVFLGVYQLFMSDLFQQFGG
ncbi:hypothetical protein BJY24_007690 [Nocardia transvalensis]|uniref:Uncharacterized protein n=1 Tax=Nocardia transvalensis TaxID=37333 RepID=A0A7W9PNB4_9NOCA|nr:hypothetical protein [Nocardia transvalensis]MBB5918778.1 hypothetical protein [Nocardia transvalensis]